MHNIMKNIGLTAADFFDLFSRTTDDYLYMWDIQRGYFYISDNAYVDFNIDEGIKTDVVKEWAGIMVPEDRQRWLEDMQLIGDGKKDYHDMEYRIYNRAGHVIWVSCRGEVNKDENQHPLFMVGRISNIGKQNKFDNITGLMNRAQFQSDMNYLLNSGVQGLVVVLDIDNFKNINEHHGYAFGDRALNLISTQLSNLLPQDCQIYRLDGDEFAFLMKDGTRESIEMIYENIQVYITNQFMMDGHKLFVSLSAGVCFFPHDGDNYQRLLRQAEGAVEIAKMNGKNQLIFFSKEIYNRRLKIIEMQESLHTCVSRGCDEFEMFYQPQIDTNTKKVVGAEALLRWHSPEHGEVSPIEFIPLLEESHLIIEVGKWVFEEAVRQCKQWQKYDPDFIMSINVSYTQLKENSLLEYLKDNDHHKLSTRNFILELTESCWVPNLHFLNQEFKNIQDMGYGIAIDDFGTGYSSLSHLKELSANIIKIDRSFIQGINQGSYEYTFLEYIVKLAHIIDLKVCVEGVETIEEYEVVKQASPDYIQGFLFGRPISAADFESRYFNDNQAGGR